MNPVEIHLHEQKELDLTQHRRAAYKQKRTVHQDAVYWVNIRLAQRKAPTFFQTRSNAIILYDTLPSFCIERVVSTKTQEALYNKAYQSPRPVPTVTLKDNWQKDWKHDAAASSSSTKPIQLNQEDQLACRAEPVRVRDRVRFDQEITSKHVEKDNVKCDLASTGTRCRN